MPLTRIDPEQVGNFSIDEKGRLYWKGEVLQTAVSLTHKQSVWAVIISVATVLAALGTVVNAGTNVYVAFIKPPATAPAPAVQPQSISPGGGAALPVKPQGTRAP